MNYKSGFWQFYRHLLKSLTLRGEWNQSLMKLVEPITHYRRRYNYTYFVTIMLVSRAVKWLKYLITINRINAIVNSRLIAINHIIFSMLNIPWILCPINFSHFNALINMEKCIGLPCANVFFLITTLAYADQKPVDTKKKPIVQLNDEYTNILPWT